MKNEQSIMKMAIAIFFLVVFVLYFYFQRTHIITPPAPAPTPTPVPISTANITVFQPAANTVVSQEFQITGKARVFENVVSFRVKNKITGAVYNTGTTMTSAQNPGTFGDFSYTVRLPSNNSPESGDNILLPSNKSPKSGDDLLLEIFQVSPKDGSDADKITIPVKFIPL